MAQSALAEVANILASACLNAISRLVNAQLVPSPPTLQSTVARAVVQRALESDVDGAGRAVVLEARFQMAGSPGVRGPVAGHRRCGEPSAPVEPAGRLASRPRAGGRPP